MTLANSTSTTSPRAIPTVWTDGHRRRGSQRLNLVLELPGDRVWAIEIKRGSAGASGKRARIALEDVKPDRAFLVYGGTERYPLPGGVEAIGLCSMAEELAGRTQSRHEVPQMKQILGLTGLALAMVACGQPDEPPAGGDGAPTLASEVRDSAGVRIVENPRPPEGSRLAWRVGPAPVVSIGALEGEEPYLLDGIRDLLTLPDGRIVVANTSSHELRVFDAAGSHLATWGGEGEGPGEFNSLVQVERWPGDSVVAWFSQDRRLSVFDAEGNFGRTLRLESDRPINADAVLPSGAILVSQSVPGGSAADGSSREQRRYEVRVAEGEQPASLGSFFGSERYTSSLGATMFLMTVPFAHRIVNFAWGELAVVASNDSYEVGAYGADGSLMRIVRIDHDLIPVTSAHRDAFVERQAAAAEPGGVTAETTRQLRDLYGDVPLPETHPAFATAMADGLDHLWVQEYNLPGEGGANPLWTVFDPEGRVLGFMETPAGLRIYEIGEDYILGQATDDLGVEYAQVWPLSRSGG